VKTVIITDADKDGLLGGPNLELMNRWKKSGFEIICAGGVTSSEDIAKLAEARIDGAIIGKALYEGKISLKQALEASK
ncbi:MAG TPA: HisA/HisF-related TIM barrel protein, partial [Candidatus Saccharimonadales bacterium]|nr:HisA/HisF-related TIM barrel protein [Candidatus Saccharimonadales bacterium]